jgi:carbonic anhydrase
MTEPQLTPDQALDKLMKGNQRFVNGWPDRPNQSAYRRREVAGGQQPFAVILACSDSRVPPEIIFDQGLGDLFVVRVAGNLVADVVLGSIEYAVEHLHTPLVVVMGHDSCGAVSAAVKGGVPDEHIGSLIKALQPAVDVARAHGGDVISHAIDANVRIAATQLKSSEPILAKRVSDNQLKIVGARYHLESGAVDRLE